MRPVLVLVLITGAPPLAQAQHPAPGTGADEQAVRRLMEDFEVGWQRGDASALARLWAEESSLGILGSAPRTRGRAEHERGFAEAFSRRAGGISRHMEIAAVGFVLPDVAIVDGVFHYGPGDVAGGEPTPARREPFAAVLVRTNGGWAFAAARNGLSVPVSPPER